MTAIAPIELPSSKRNGHRPTLQIQELVALSYGFHPKLMIARDGRRHIAWPRQVAMYLTRKFTHRSLPAIGEAFGHRDHTTVIHAIRQVEKRIAVDPWYAADILAFEEVLAR